jgi:hypothetical protein
MNLNGKVAQRPYLRAAGLLVLGAFMLGLIGELHPILRRLWASPSNGPVRVSCEAESVGRGIKVSYTVLNQTSSTILVFDQMARDDTQSDAHPYGLPDESWAYVEFERDGWSFSGWAYKAILSRRIKRPYADQMHFEATLPYARRLAAGEKLTGSFLLPLPLKEELARSWGDVPRNPDVPFDMRINVREFELWIGWSADMPLESVSDAYLNGQFSYHDQKLWYFYPHWGLTLDEMQHVATSDAKAAHWNGLLY